MGLRSADGSFSDLGRSQWNEIIYTKIAVMGDSLSAQWPLFADAWPNLLQTRLNSAGARVEVREFATGSHSFFRANTVATYGSDTAVNKVIGYKPDVVIVELGGNDSTGVALGTGDARTQGQIEADATATFAALAAGLPSALLIQLKLTLHDTANFTSSNVKNKGILPRWMTRKAAGILTGLDTSEYLDDNVSAANRGILDAYDSLMTVITAISGVQVITIDLWKIERLGVGLVDRTHYTAFGHALIAGDVMKQLRANAAFTAIVPVIATQLTGSLFEGEDVEALFDDYLVGSGDAYVDNTPGVLNGEDTNSSWVARVIHPNNWFMAYKGSCYLDRSTVYQGNGFEGFLGFYIDGGIPNTLVTYSVDGAAFSTTGYTTDGEGRIRGTVAPSVLNLSLAAHDFRFKVGNDVYGPFSVTLATNIFFITNHTSVGNVGTGTDTLMTNTLTAGWFLPTAGRRLGVKQHGTTANNANGKTISSMFGNTTVFSFVATLNLAGDWRFEYEAVSTGEDAQKFQGTVWAQTGAGTALSFPFHGTATLDDDAAITISCTGAGVNDNDITQLYQEIDPR